MISNAIGAERISRIVGYIIKKGNFSAVTPYLPQRIAIIGEGNEANQATMPVEPTQITSSQQAGEIFGYGSPIHGMARIIFPVNSEGVGGIPVYVYAQEKAVGATTKQMEIAPTGVATGNTTHTVVIAGRTNLDAVPYGININTGDDAGDIAQKIADAINNVLGCPVSALADDYDVTLETKWAGLTAQQLSVIVNTNGNDVGITYAVTQVQAAAGTPSIAGALSQFGSTWNTIVANSYGTQATVCQALEDFNGIPAEIPTGRYVGIIMKPFIAVTGSTADDPTSFTDPRKQQVTIAIAPAPNSPGFAYEAAANMIALLAPIVQNSPHLDVAGQFYPDMPIPANKKIGSMSSYNNRDAFVKKGCSTVDIMADRYLVQDFVSTYHPDGEVPPQFRWVRNQMIDFNVRYMYYLQEQINVVDHAIANDDDVVDVDKVIKPKQWKQILSSLADTMGKLMLIVDVQFTKDSIEVGISAFNPDRLETFFRYKRSGFARESATTAEAGFNTGPLN